MSNFPCYEPTVQRSIQKQRTLETIDTLCSRCGYDKNYFHIIVSVNQLSLYGAVAEMCEEYESLHEGTGDPLSEGNRVPHSCQARSRQKCLWIEMNLLAKIFYCNNMENELRSCHNKTN